MIRTVFNMSEELREGSDLFEKLGYLLEELGELSTECLIIEGLSMKEAGNDGVVGEAIDVILCALDIIHYEEPHISDEELEEIMIKKCQKWKAHVLKRRAKIKINT